ncbi:DNA primase, partial [Buchnera aphidicola (Hormaphis cornu)]
FFLRELLIQKIGIINDFQFKKLFLTYNNKIKQNKIIHVKHTTIRILIGLLVQNPWLAHTIPDISNISHLKIPGLHFFLELIQICNKHLHLNTGQLIELYRHSNRADILKKIASWDHMIVSAAISNVFLDALTLICNKGLEIRQEHLITKGRTTGLNKIEKIELWNINKELAKS